VCLRPDYQRSCRIALKFNAKCIGTSVCNKYYWGPSRRGEKGCSCGNRDKSQPLFVLWRERESASVSVFRSVNSKASSNLSHQTKNKVRVFATQKHYLQLHDLSSSKFCIRSSPSMRLAGLLFPWYNSWLGIGTPRCFVFARSIPCLP
jgi:hypothetical protein